MRVTPFANGEFYHIYNRGVDKRTIFEDTDDVDRFFQSMQKFNSLEPIGSIYESSFPKIKKTEQGARHKSFVSEVELADERLVNFVCYCLNPNHYHFILEQVAEKGIEKFMQRLGTGYTKYFNTRHERSGSLFQGVFKSAHIDTDEYLLHVSAYVNLNNKCHQLGSEASKLVRSSWNEYVGEGAREAICTTGAILERFKNRREYEEFAESSLEGILERKRFEKLTTNVFLD